MNQTGSPFLERKCPAIPLSVRTDSAWQFQSLSPHATNSFVSRIYDVLLSPCCILLGPFFGSVRDQDSV